MPFYIQNISNIFMKHPSFSSLFHVLNPIKGIKLLQITILKTKMLKKIQDITRIIKQVFDIMPEFTFKTTKMSSFND